MENNKDSEKEKFGLIKKVFRLFTFIFKSLILISAALFIASLLIWGILGEAPKNSADLLTDGEGRVNASITRTSVNTTTPSINSLPSALGSIVFTGCFLTMLLIFLSPIFFILKKLLEDVTRDIGGFVSSRSQESKASNKSTKIYRTFRYKLLGITKFLFSEDTQESVFEPIMADWDTEFFAALKINKILMARWISIKYTYLFLLTMWHKSPIGDLIEFISSKLAR